MFPQFCGMAKRNVREVRMAVLKAISDSELHSFGELERKVNTNWKSIRNHCEDLEFFECATRSDEGVKITKQGLHLLKKIK